MDIGLELRQRREDRGLTLQQLSHITKISPRVLQAIEAGDDSRLPAPVYTRAFVKTYASEVGLDPAEALRRFVAQFEPPDDDGIVVPPPELRRAAHPLQALGELRLSSPHAAPIAIVTVIVAIVALSIGRRAPVPAPASAPQPRAMAAGFVPAAPPQERPVGTTGTSPASALHLAIAPTGPCWMQATVGENRVFATLLQPGERRIVDAPSAVTLRVGDPAACAFTINGKPARIAGAAGQASTVRITTDNYRQFLPSE